MSYPRKPRCSKASKNIWNSSNKKKVS